MAGIEQLEVHSKSYIVRWVQVNAGDTLSWSVQPHKKSINFGIVKHPGSGATSLSSLTGSNNNNASGDLESSQLTEAKGSRFPKKDATAEELLASKGFIPVRWVGKCEADKVSIGQHEVGAGETGMYGLVFDNTFSKQTSKTATFVVLTYPTGAAPQGAARLPNLQTPSAGKSQTSLGKATAGRLDGAASNSADSLHSHHASGQSASVSAPGDNAGAAALYHVGTLSKRRRKKGQGYARRFFSLDYSTCTLSYYYNRNSSALRGAIPLSLAAVAADEKRREINIDSGAEIWHLRAPNDQEFRDWAQALAKASRIARGLETVQQPARPTPPTVDTRHLKTPLQSKHDEDAEWQQIETLVSRMVGTRDALRRLTKDVTAATTNGPVQPAGQFLSPASAGLEEKEGYFPGPEKKPFWKRKSSTGSMAPSNLHGSATASTPTGEASSAAPRAHQRSKSKAGGQEEKTLPAHCQAMLADLDSVIGEFTALITSSKRRRMPTPLSATGASRRSMDTTASSVDEFFDAEDAKNERDVVHIEDGSDEDEHESSDEEASFQDSSSVSSVGDENVSADDMANLYPPKPKSLTPLPVEEPVARRSRIPPSPGPPPSLIALVRKNVGKDLSTISMPVSTNEPTSMLQKVAEQLEYAQLLDQAAREKTATERLLYVTAFAVSSFSSSRAKERAVRKPFTPLLGETYELVRGTAETPGNFRLLVEKVQHRPIKLAMQADSASWSLSQCASPGQKFWGKSAEITTDGRVRLVLRLADGGEELYSWDVATMFLRNVVMGEKYVEPVGTMTVACDTTGARATVEFKQKGMFGAKIEDVAVETFHGDGTPAGGQLFGTWTTSLRRGTSAKNAGEEIWRAGPLADNASQAYGLTAFAASLNEVTGIERGRMAPTDCRHRPDQRMVEEGDLDGAEAWKVRLEEAQRERRRALEEAGEEYRARWFVKVRESEGGEDIWRIKGGKDSYWEERTRGKWEGCLNLFDA